MPALWRFVQKDPKTSAFTAAMLYAFLAPTNLKPINRMTGIDENETILAENTKGMS